MGDISLGPNHWVCFISGACIELACNLERENAWMAWMYS